MAENMFRPGYEGTKLMQDVFGRLDGPVGFGFHGVLLVSDVNRATGPEGSVAFG
jgi:hypothetical protein